MGSDMKTDHLQKAEKKKKHVKQNPKLNRIVELNLLSASTITKTDLSYLLKD